MQQPRTIATRLRSPWFGLGSLRKFEAYTAWSLYLLIAMLPVILLQWNLVFNRANAAITTVFWVVIAALTVLGIATIRDIVVALREQRAPHASLRWICLAVGGAALALAAVLLRGVPSDKSPSFWVPIIIGGYTLGITSAQAPRRMVLTQTLIGYAAVLGVIALHGRTGSVLVATAIGFAFFTGAAIVSVRASIAMLRLMHEIDRSRDVASQLAVAEERLRFARDMHDTLGRNLSAIALKSQVAAQLATRNTEASIDEMDAVRRLAGDSLTEMREVVRGYRAVDLPTELRGARSLLRSASIEPRFTIGPAEIPMQLQDAVGWVVREAVTNVIRHSSARYCLLEATNSGGVLEVRIVNDRPNPTGSPSGGPGGSGLDGLGERLARFGGTLTQTSSNGLFELTARFTTETAAPADQPATSPTGSTRAPGTVV